MSKFHLVMGAGVIVVGLLAIWVIAPLVTTHAWSPQVKTSIVFGYALISGFGVIGLAYRYIDK